MSNAADCKTTATWTTWEELLLGFAVKRHGLNDWETVAMELQSRHRGNCLFTAEICRLRYQSLRKRFVNRQYNRNRGAAAGGGAAAYSGESDGDDNHDALAGDNGGGGDGGDDDFWWLEELRKLRVAELKKEVQRNDLSIESLQTKVRKMEEEREKSLATEANEPDLTGELKEERSENGNNNGEKASSGDVAGKSVSGEEDNRSFNESNSTENRGTGLTKEPKPVEVQPDSGLKKPVGKEDSCNDSSDRTTSHEQKKQGDDSEELPNSSAESKEGSQAIKESSDVQSSVSLEPKNRVKVNKTAAARKKDGAGEVTTVAHSPTMPTKTERGIGFKAEPLFGLLDIIRSHKHGSAFKRRLESQKSGKYKKIIRQHMDLETIQTRLEKGSYTPCPKKFYADLLLLFNNAIIFFPKSSSVFHAAHELRRLVMNHLKQNSPPPVPTSIREPTLQSKSQLERSDSLLAKNKSTAPIIVCKKRTSITAKPSPSVNKVEKRDEDKPYSDSKPSIKPTMSSSNEEDGSTKLKVKEKPVTGVRSARKSITGRPNNTRSEPSANPKPSSIPKQRDARDKAGSSKAGDASEKAGSSKASGDKKKAEVNAVVNKKGAADFLKRIKKNDPGKGKVVEASKSSGESLRNSRKDHQSKGSDYKKDAVRSSNRGGGGSGVKNAKEESSPPRRNIGRPLKKGKEVLKGKRGREVNEEEGSSKQPIKRARR